MWLRRFTAALLTALLLGSLGGQTVQAQNQPSTSAFTVPPGGRVQVTFTAFCIQFGDYSFPYAIQAPNANNNPALATDAVRKLLIYAKNNKVENDPQKALEVQRAIWRQLGVKGISGGDSAISGSQNITISDPANARSILDKTGWNNKEWGLDTTSWTPLSEPLHLTDSAIDFFYGRGLMTVKNNTNNQLSLFMPDGTIIYPAGKGRHQQIAGYLTGVTVIVMPKTAGVSMPLVLAVFTTVLAAGVHFWRMRRQSLWFARPA